MPHDVTLNDLLARLRGADDHPVAFRTPHRAVRPGYHLTEFKLAHVRSVDCGRGAHEWDEAIVELMDGDGGDAKPMRASKLASIVAEVIAALPAMGDAPLVVEFGAEGLMRYRIEAIELDRATEAVVETEADGATEADEYVGRSGWIVSLVPLRGQCKAMLQPTCCASQRTPAAALCCGAA